MRAWMPELGLPAPWAFAAAGLVVLWLAGRAGVGDRRFQMTTRRLLPGVW